MRHRTKKKHQREGAVDRSRGDPTRKRAKDQARWERSHGGRRHGLEAEGEAEATLLRFSQAQLAWLRAQAEARDVSVAHVVRELVDRA